MDLFEVIKKRFATAFGKRISEISSSDMSQVRELTAREFISGSLFDNEAGYAVTPKADGFRKILFFYERGIYTFELKRKGEFVINFICTTPSAVPTAIIDSELVDNRFLCFDLIYFGERVEKDSYLQRLKKLDNFFREIGGVLRKLTTLPTPVFIEKKMVMVLYTAGELKTMNNPTQNFFDKINKILSVTLDYPVDGLIFTPIKTPFDSLKISDKMDLREFPESCKWKPPEMLSADFRLQGRELLVSVGGEEIPFEARGFDMEQNVDWDSLIDVEDGEIIEMKATVGKEETKLFYSRHRPDKFKPNSLKAVRTIWGNILDPITVDTLSGKNFYLVRKYHNSIKRELLQFTNQGSYLLDIGSGKGGDLSKFNNFSKILCIEPNPDNVTEFKRRFKDYPQLQSKLKLLETGCCSQSLTHEIIDYFGDGLKDQKLYISMMLSLSFFWRDRETTISLIRLFREICTVCKNVEFIYLTVDGPLLDNLFNRKGDFINLHPAILNRSGNEVNINIENSIVTDQTEYLVYTNDILEGCYFHLKTYEVANENDYLSDNEKTFSSVYTYGRMTSTKRSRYLSPGERQEVQIEKDKYFIVGVGREENKKECLRFFEIDEDVTDEDKWETISMRLMKKILVISYDGFNLIEAPEESSIIIFQDLDGYCYPLVEN